jgi:replicative DNA helicase
MHADLRDLGTFEQDADVVCFMYREEYSLSRDEPR